MALDLGHRPKAAACCGALPLTIPLPPSPLLEGIGATAGVFADELMDEDAFLLLA